ncbi:MAG: adenine deaminase C-terminal domain-containing protein, partial [Nitrospinota bacterium]
LRDRGAVAPGKRADLVTFGRLNRPYIRDVWVEGEPVARDGRLLRPWAAPKVRGGVGRLRVPPSALERLAVPAKGRRIRAIRAFPDQIVTGTEILEARVEGGQAVPDPGRDILKLSLFERHRGTGNVGVGFVRGFGLRRGALASTVAHDAHNLIAVGASDAAIRTAAEAAIRMGGGMVAVRGKRVLADLPLPLWGLMSERPAAEVAARKRALDRAARALGSSLPDPFLTLSFLALSVIPTLKISDRGLVDVTRFQRVPLFVR